MKAVLFDFDGTIADTFPLFVQLIEKYAKKLNIDLTSIQDLKIDIKEFSMRDLFKKFQVSIFKLIRYGRKFQNEIGENVANIQGFPGVSDLIKSLHNQGITVGVVTVNKKKTVVEFLEKEGLSEFVTFIISDRLSLNKFRSLTKAIRKYDLDPKNTLYVGDDVTDVTSSNRVGIKCICVSWGYNSKKLLSSKNPLVADNVAMLRDFLDKELK